MSSTEEILTIGRPVAHAAGFAGAGENRARPGAHAARNLAAAGHLGQDLSSAAGTASADLNDVLRRAGIGRGSTSSPTVYLVGAGTSDYTGRALGSVASAALGLRRVADSQHDAADRIRRFPPPRKRISLDFVFPLGRKSGRCGAVWSRRSTGIAQIRHLVITCNQQGPMAQLCSRHPDRAVGSGARRCGERPRPRHDQFVQQYGSGRAVRGASGGSRTVRRGGCANVRDRAAVSSRCGRNGCRQYVAGLYPCAALSAREHCGLWPTNAP